MFDHVFYMELLCSGMALLLMIISYLLVRYSGELYLEEG